MSTHPERLRQIHLDFHTSPLMPDVAKDFNAEQFADTLAKAHVDSVTCFARCHHGMLYYPSTWRPDLIHPTLHHHDLLNQQIAACHERGIKVPVYTTIQWDEHLMHAHREWLLVTPEGGQYSHGPLTAGFYPRLDVFHPGYRQFLRDHLADLLQHVPDLDGLFLDICPPFPSLARHWIEAMDEANLDPENEQHRKDFAKRVMRDWQLETTDFLRGLPQWTPGKTIFYNSGHLGPRHRDGHEAFTHFEVESLPSGAWGYLHFPLSASYARTLGKPTLGMTGKFHTAWGDFHSYKNEAALEFESMRTIAFGCGVSIGDQLPPDGVLDEQTYENISVAYDAVEQAEPWVRDFEPVKEIGILTPEAFSAQAGRLAQAERQHDADSGAVRLLGELGRQFDRIDSEADFGDYRVLVLPDRVPVDDKLKAKLKSYLDNGGKLLASYECGQAADLCDVEFTGPGEFEPDFVQPVGGFCPDLPRALHVMYERGLAITPGGDTTSLADTFAPHFNRTWRHFSSHRHAPSGGRPLGPAVVQNAAGNAIYFRHPIFETYHHFGPRWCRLLVQAALDRLSPPMLTADAPIGTVLTLTRKDDRHALHVLYYPAERKAAGHAHTGGGASTSGFDIVEDRVELNGVNVHLSLPANITTATLQPSGETLEVIEGVGAQTIRIAPLHARAIVELRT
ncbi:MAG: beta-galactosidase trimerization domain-containing protein [Planctomycetota bacterium]